MCILAKSYLPSLPLGIIPGSLNVAFAKLDKTIRVRIPSYTGIATVYSTAKEGHLKAKKNSKTETSESLQVFSAWAQSEFETHKTLRLTRKRRTTLWFQSAELLHKLLVFVVM